MAGNQTQHLTVIFTGRLDPGRKSRTDAWLSGQLDVFWH